MPDENKNFTQSSYRYTCGSGSRLGVFPFICTDSAKFTLENGQREKQEPCEKYLIIAVLEGSGEVAQGGESRTLDEGRAILLDCRTPLEYAAVGDKCLFCLVHFTAQTMEGYASSLLSALTPVRLRNRGHFEKLIYQCSRLLRQSDYESCAVGSNIISNLLTEMICSEGEEAESSVKVRPEIAELEEYIRTNCHEQLHLQDFMEHSYFSKYHMIRLFVAQVGMSPYKYLHACRVSQAQKILETSGASISEVAYSVGYSDPIVFTRHFKAVVGVTPSEYRHEHSRGQNRRNMSGNEGAE